jgi:hypothetical protein
MSRLLTLDQVNQKTADLVRQHAPISLRDLCNRFTAKHRPQVRLMVELWAQQGSLVITGTGRRNNPLVVRVKDPVTPKTDSPESSTG